MRATADLHGQKILGFMLAHEQFPVPQPIDQILADWPIGTDPAVDLAAVEKLFDSGATIVNIHSGQPDQKKVVDFYGKNVLPKIRGRA